jgi:sterol desaturase/sphingolipid hydroxylase (fatty acid hydroxylase superfamily)
MALLQAHPHGRGVYLVALVAVIAEVVWRLRIARKGYDVRGAAATLGVAAGDLLFGAAYSLVVGAVFALAASWAPVHWPLADWRTWAVGFVVVEFAYYWFHRLSHEVRWMWATHATHHSPEQITLLSAIRLGWTSLFSLGWLVYAPVVLAGFDPRLVAALLAFDLNYQFFLHTEARISLGPLEWLLNSPSHHRVHHATNAPYLDRNYGGVLIVFDRLFGRLFGTFAAERADEPPRYGLVHPLGAAHNPLTLALGEWGRLFADLRRAPSLAAALRIAAGRPG